MYHAIWMPASSVRSKVLVPFSPGSRSQAAMRMRLVMARSKVPVPVSPAFYREHAAGRGSASVRPRHLVAGGRSRRRNPASVCLTKGSVSQASVARPRRAHFCRRTIPKEKKSKMRRGEKQTHRKLQRKNKKGRVSADGALDRCLPPGGNPPRASCPRGRGSADWAARVR